MNTRPHCSKSRPIGTGGQQMPVSTTASWRIGSAASPPNAGFRIRRESYSISPGDMIPEPIISVADLLTLAGRRGVRVGGLLGTVRLSDLGISRRYCRTAFGAHDQWTTDNYCQHTSR